MNDTKQPPHANGQCPKCAGPMARCTMGPAFCPVCDFGEAPQPATQPQEGIRIGHCGHCRKAFPMPPDTLQCYCSDACAKASHDNFVLHFGNKSDGGITFSGPSEVLLEGDDARRLIDALDRAGLVESTTEPLANRLREAWLDFKMQMEGFGLSGFKTATGEAWPENVLSAATRLHALIEENATLSAQEQLRADAAAVNEPWRKAMQRCPLHNTPLVKGLPGCSGYCPACKIGFPEQQPSTTTPTPVLRWQTRYRQINRAAGIETRTLQQLWQIREGTACRQEWRDVPEAAAPEE